MNPDILVKPSSALVSRLSKVGLFKGLTKMSEFFLGLTQVDLTRAIISDDTISD